MKRVHCGDVPTPNRSKASAIVQFITVLLGCGLRRRELADLSFDHLQRREDRWAIVDLVGKGGHIRTVPIPTWVKQFLDEWFAAAQITQGNCSGACAVQEPCGAME